jgi:phage baseplate assembly protein W
MSDQNEILGRGWAFPPSFNKQANDVAMLEGEADLQNSVHVIIHTKLGERILRAEFGSTIHDLIFEPLNENIKTYMSASLRNALELNEPRIEVLDITLEQENPTIGRVDIAVAYRSIETNVTNNLVVPFYTENLEA